MQCFQFCHDSAGETSAFVFEHMCDGTKKNFDLLQKANLIFQSLQTEEAEEIKEAEAAKAEAEEIKEDEGVEEIKDSEAAKAEVKETKTEGVEEVSEN